MANNLYPETPLPPEMGGEPAITPDEQLVNDLISKLDLGAAPEPPKVGTGRRILGSIGDALLAYAAVKAGGAPPQMGPFAAGQLAQQRDYEAQKSAYEGDVRRIRVREFENAIEREKDERIRARTEAHADAQFQISNDLQQRRVDLEQARLELEQMRLSDQEKKNANSLIEAAKADMDLEQARLNNFDLAENSSAALSDSAVSLIERLRASGDPGAEMKAEAIDAHRMGLLRGINLARDKASQPGVLEALDSQANLLLSEMDSGGKLLSTSQGPTKSRKITDTTIKYVSGRNAAIEKIQIAKKAAEDLKNDLGKSGVLFNKPLPQWSRDPQLKDAAAKILPIMAQLRSDIFGATLPAGEIEIAGQFIDSAITLDLDGMIIRLDNLLEREIIEQQNLADIYHDVDDEAAKKLFSSFELIKSGGGRIPEGLPPGSTFFKNTINGGKIYTTPSGEKFTVREQ